MVFSPTSAAACVSISGEMTKPQVDSVWATAAASLPTTAAGLFIAK
jgi:hypothetical protein